MNPKKWFEEKLKKARNTIEYKTEILIQKFLMEITERMKEQNVTAAELASRMGVSKGRVSTLLKGKHNMRIDTMVALADALNMEIKLEVTPKERSDYFYHLLEWQIYPSKDWLLSSFSSAGEILSGGRDAGEPLSKDRKSTTVIGGEYEPARAA